ncbi:formyltetrahydrofolate-dependent phosphoribosylglycinamide formyltransferase [Jatrophihabitans sp. GAS493]|uniref:phosphoribosylglycinamide formyltransferase n=1 Tax=Jatrophihabitans sp. GAS493 TaxID=1907575 RepID=UPI000BB8145B|nr:phosphoribosylglycinamide formyltransferase [Jatrophihabitans sp. GAS493]SOD71941.1 formyltetrahydrofolate-dependent phosphoribosylglycinamide formyltransferase [Jatrophihabitans sp. GAS493]
MPARLVILASGSGTTAQAIIDAAAAEEFGGTVVALGSDVVGCTALDRAVTAGVPTFTESLTDYPSRIDWNEALADTIGRHRPDIVCLAGFMRILGPAVVSRFTLVNTHPSLLPAFPGAHAIRDALAHGVKVSGVTVHRVDEGLDTGPILAQAAVAVLDDDSEDTLRDRIQAAEKPLYVDTISRLCKEIQ